MKKNFLKKIVIVLIAGLGIMTYSCSEEDLFEEELNVRSFAKRNMSSSNEIDTRPVSPIEGSYYSGSSISGKCDIKVEWTHGYITGNGPQAILSAKVENCRAVNARNISVSCNWIGYYGIVGTVIYTYDVVEKYDSAGVEIMRFIPMNKSDQFNFSPHVNIITEERLNDLLGYN